MTIYFTIFGVFMHNIHYTIYNIIYFKYTEKTYNKF